MYLEVERGFREIQLHITLSIGIFQKLVHFVNLPKHKQKISYLASKFPEWNFCMTAETLQTTHGSKMFPLNSNTKLLLVKGWVSVASYSSFSEVRCSCLQTTCIFWVKLTRFASGIIVDTKDITEFYMGSNLWCDKRCILEGNG